jgi:hypothetical protein
MLKVTTARLRELHTDTDDATVTLVFEATKTDLQPGHFLQGNPGGFTLMIFNTDRAVLTQDATPKDVAAAAQSVVRGSRR